MKSKQKDDKDDPLPAHFRKNRQMCLRCMAIKTLRHHPKDIFLVPTIIIIIYFNPGMPSLRDEAREKSNRLQSSDEILLKDKFVAV